MSPPDADLPDEGEPLRHNTANAVTGGVDRVRGANGQRLVRKRLHGPSTRVGSGLWAASDDPTHWNYWRREIEAYADPELSAALAGTGLRLPVLDHLEAHGPSSASRGRPACAKNGRCWCESGSAC